jgi:phosphoenolpyruvate synthase/pyruvate phosphate dikinase
LDDERKPTIIPAFNGFCVTTEAYRTFSTTNDVQTKMIAVLKAMDITLPASLETASATIHGFFAQAVILLNDA